MILNHYKTAYYLLLKPFNYILINIFKKDTYFNILSLPKRFFIKSFFIRIIMQLTETKLKGCFILEPKLFKDSRGYFFESFNQENHRKNFS